jgi:hypothetical protein
VLFKLGDTQQVRKRNLIFGQAFWCGGGAIKEQQKNKSLVVAATASL